MQASLASVAVGEGRRGRRVGAKVPRFAQRRDSFETINGGVRARIDLQERRLAP
jgi:hypothetical protein